MVIVLWTLLFLFSLFVGFVSIVALAGVLLNKFLKSSNKPSLTFNFPVLKIFTISFVASIVLFVTSITGIVVADTDGFFNMNNDTVNENEPDEVDVQIAIENDEEINQKAIDAELKKDAELKAKKERLKAAQAEKEEAEKKKVEKELAEKKKTEEQQVNKSLSGMKVHFIDVGQADAALIQYSDKAILIDSGNWNGNQSVQYLHNQGIKKLDVVIGTHPHADHIGQIDKIIEQFDVDEVWLSGGVTNSNVFTRVLEAIDKHDIDYDEPRAGDHYQIGDLSIQVLSPTGLSGNLNNDSIVLKLTYGAISFLFTGDAEAAAESQMVNSGQNLQSTILKVGHHGSDTSSTPLFIDKVNPKAAIISVGTNSQYNHPNQSVVDRFKQKNIDLYATNTNGTIVVSTNGQTYDIHANKQGEVVAGDAALAVAKNQETKSKAKKNSKQTSTKEEAKPKQETKPKQQSEPKQETKPKQQAKPKQEKPKSSGSCVNINTASESEVQAIKHIGEVRAKDLIANRPYHSVDDLTKIKGIAAGRLADIKAEGIACVK